MNRLGNFFWSTKWGLILLFGMVTALIVGGVAGAINPSYQGMDEAGFIPWLLKPGRPLGHSLWVWGLIIFTGAVLVNGLGCTIRFLMRRRPSLTRWTFLLLHLGAFLIPVSYLAGSGLGGLRVQNIVIPEGSPTNVPGLPENSRFQVSEISPIFSPEGKPIDFPFQAKILIENRELASETVRLNHPLIHRGTIIYPVSFQYRPGALYLEINGNRQQVPVGKKIAVGEGRKLMAMNIIPDYGIKNGRAFRVLGLGRKPAVELTLEENGAITARGWLLASDPEMSTFKSVGLTVNNPEIKAFRAAIVNVTVDRFYPLAAIGGLLFTIGLVADIFLFYRRYGSLRPSPRP